MWCNQIFSLIDGQRTIQNIIVADNYEIANQLARQFYGENAYSVDTTFYPVSIGCKHIDGIFYDESEEIEIPRNLTPDEEANYAKLKVDALEVSQAYRTVDLDFRLSMIELGL